MTCEKGLMSFVATLNKQINNAICNVMSVPVIIQIFFDLVIHTMFTLHCNVISISVICLSASWNHNDGHYTSSLHGYLNLFSLHGTMQWTLQWTLHNIWHFGDHTDGHYITYDVLGITLMDISLHEYLNLFSLYEEAWGSHWWTLHFINI